MPFYRIDVALSEKAEAADRKQKTERPGAIPDKNTEVFFEQSGHTCHISISNLMDKKPTAVLCAATKNGSLTDAVVSVFLDDIALNYAQFSVKEITLEAYFSLLRAADQNHFSCGEDDVAEKLKISSLTRRRARIDYTETILNGASTKDSLAKQADDLLSGSLVTEIEKIFQGALTSVPCGHPVHYMVQTDDESIRKKIVEILLRSLAQNNRIMSRRYCEKSYRKERAVPGEGTKALYESCIGGTIVVNFEEEYAEFGSCADLGKEILIKVCEMVREYRNRVLTVFCLPKHCENLSAVLFDNIGSVSLVRLTDELAFDEKAHAHLRGMAKEHGVRPDKELYKAAEAGKGYSRANLQQIYDAWYDRRLKTKVYPQYADYKTAKTSAALKNLNDHAAEGLAKMVGLREAKETLNRALDFYKAQRLFRDKGFSVGKTSMHMIFTGNPGTAKTTVARLFAQIMKDNGLLSVGDLYEVGRADLVGKYVGWTAPVVIQKFKDAKGSVLFIDEAYSLVDDRDGLFGDEAISAIVQEMENRREDTVVIFAGYPDKMEAFLLKNPGLRSRIAFHVSFDDYSANELYQITELMAENRNLKLGTGIREKLVPFYEAARKIADFGNGRFVRNQVEKAVMRQASRLVAMDIAKVTASDVARLIPEDFEVSKTTGREAKRIGFCCEHND